MWGEEAIKPYFSNCNGWLEHPGQPLGHLRGSLSLKGELDLNNKIREPFTHKPRYP